MISAVILSLAVVSQYPQDRFMNEIVRGEARLAQPMPPNLGWKQTQWEANRRAIQQQLTWDRLGHEDEVQRRIYDKTRRDWMAIAPQLQWQPRYPSQAQILNQNLVPTHVWTPYGGRR